MLIFIMDFSDEDNGKFARLYNDFHDSLMKYAYKLLRNRHDSEETVHEAFIRVLKNLDKLSENERSKTWHYMVIVVKNVALSKLKKEKPSVIQDLGDSGMDDIVDDSEPVWSEYHAKELYTKIREYIVENLDETERQILTLRAGHNLSYKDIANIVGISESNVSVKLTRIRKKMKRDLMMQEAEI